MILNYGHTYGHAIEKATKFTTPHGFAVSIGMCIVNDMAVKEGLMRPKHANRIKSLLNAAELPTAIPKKIKKTTLNSLIKFDKKRRGDNQNFVIVPKIGTAAIVEKM